MAQVDGKVRVFVAQGEVLPSAFRRNGRTLRVLSAEAAGVRGNERRYRLHTREGTYELGVTIGTGMWHVRHAPRWIARLWAGIQRGPRYPLSGWRRRRAWRTPAQPAASHPRIHAAETARTTA